MSNARASYHEDYHSWATEQPELLRTGNFTEIDSEHLADEIENLGTRLKREIEGRLAILLLHLIRWEYQPELRGKGWQSTILVQRRTLAGLLRESPSLRVFLREALEAAHEQAVLRAELETNWPRDCYPWTCKWSLEQVLDDEFLPEQD